VLEALDIDDEIATVEGASQTCSQRTQRTSTDSDVIRRGLNALVVALSMVVFADMNQEAAVVSHRVSCNGY
jgi:hypothetical protein